MGALILVSSMALAVSGPPSVTATICPAFAASTDRASAGTDTEVTTANGSDRQTSYDRYIALFDPAAKIHGLVPGVASLADVRKHYRAVFFELSGGTLVEDERIVAGPMSAHRYHSMMTLTGTFDGVVAKDKPVTLRGQTFFRFGDDGRIVERWSNHDHAYRMGQLLGDKGREEGAKLGAALNGDGLSEQRGYDFVDDWVSAFSKVEAPAERRAALAAMLDDAVQVHGIGCGTLDKAGYLEWLDRNWAAFPDLFMTPTGRPMSGWSMVAFRWRVAGSQRADFEGEKRTGRTAVSQDGQAIISLTSEGRARNIWLNLSPHQYRRY